MITLALQSTAQHAGRGSNESSADFLLHAAHQDVQLLHFSEFDISSPEELNDLFRKHNLTAMLYACFQQELG